MYCFDILSNLWRVPVVDKLLTTWRNIGSTGLERIFIIVYISGYLMKLTAVNTVLFALFFFHFEFTHVTRIISVFKGIYPKVMQLSAACTRVLCFLHSSLEIWQTI